VQRQWRISQRESLQNALMRRCRLTYMYAPSQVRLYLTFGTGKMTGGAGTHKRHTGPMHTGAHRGTRITQTNLITMYHPNPPKHPHDTARRPVGLAARPLPVT
jgi:hypothetical protein